MDVVCDELVVRFASTAQALPSWGESVVVSLSMYMPVLGFQRSWFAAVLMVSAVACQEAMGEVSLRARASDMPWLRV